MADGRQVSSRRRPTRPLDGKRSAAILQATLAVVGERGYDNLTVDAVAARAKASKATMYRRWPSKADMVADAVRTMNPGPEYPDTGSLRGDLTQGLLAFLDNEDDVRVVVGIASAIGRHPELRQVLQEQFLPQQAERNRSVYQRALERGELSEECDPELLIAVVRGVLLDQLLFNTAAMDRDFVVRVVDDVVLPLATATRTSGVSR